MREYLFRGKRKDNGQWVFGGILPDTDSVEIVTLETFSGYFNPRSGYGEPPSSELCEYSVDPNTIGEYCERCDASWRKIFTGDIVKIDSALIGEIGFNQEQLEYTITAYGKSIPFGPFIHSKIEIIGNIYDNPNPKMLEKEEE